MAVVHGSGWNERMLSVVANPGERVRSRADTGMRAVFWTWMGIVTVGLAVMIVIPLTGR